VTQTQIGRLLDIMARLRDPQSGCPWDRVQTWSTISPHTLEEAYELADAIASGAPERVRDELGDVLFQVVFQARIAQEQGLFDFEAVAAAISDKLERRHPHVFAGEKIADVDAQSKAWEAHKAREREGYAGAAGALDGVALALPALVRAAKLGKRASGVGFDWPDVAGVLSKVREEVDELHAAVQTGDQRHVTEELGDLLFSLAQAARQLDVDPEDALRSANAKFERRFRMIEQALRERGLRPGDVGLDELESLWIQVKRTTG